MKINVFRSIRYARSPGFEQPFVLGSQEAWRAAPALAGADWSEIEPIGRRMRQLWANFARGIDADSAWSADAVRVLP